MENENKEAMSSGEAHIVFTKSAELRYYKELRQSLVKLLYLIEDEEKGVGSADAWLYGFVFDLASANTMCDNKLNKVLVKIHGLYEHNSYKTMSHADIKRQIMESRGIVDHLISEMEAEASSVK